jgi:succinate-acetate transporter protein
MATPAEHGPPPLRVETATRVVLRPVASPFALGFLALAGASLTVGALEAGWIPVGETREVGVIVLVFAPVLQAIACVFGFLGRDAVAATGMGVLAGTWAVVGAVDVVHPHGTTHALGVFLFLAATGALLSATIAVQTKAVPAAALAATAVRFTLTGVYQVTASDTWKDAAGYAGLVLAFIALYAAYALELEDTKRHTVLPTLRHGEGRRVLAGDLPKQVEGLGNEAGVRQQL